MALCVSPVLLLYEVLLFTVLPVTALVALVVRLLELVHNLLSKRAKNAK